MSDAKKTIQDTVEQNRVVLFMKGTKNFPQCGFSQRAVAILKECKAEFKDVNVLADPARGRERWQGCNRHGRSTTFMTINHDRTRHDLACVARCERCTITTDNTARRKRR